MSNKSGLAGQSLSSLATIELPAGLTSIGARAFQGCSSLATIELPAGLSPRAATLMTFKLKHASSGFDGTVTHLETCWATGASQRCEHRVARDRHRSIHC